ncbi:hypothetical protein C8J56DRAFT_954890 [Mycena floridula]|nr:hypothetical protein C8J56DRAFT_954890 [Mycena floridula]
MSHECTSTKLIPPELVLAIIDETDDVTLKSFSLVSRSFWPHCRRLIFSNLTFSNIGTGNGPARCQRFHRLVQQSPEVSLLVRHLVLEQHQAKGLWITLERTLPAVLSMLPNLQSISLICSSYSLQFNYPSHWDEMSTELRTALLNIFQLPTMRRIVLRGMPSFTQISDLANLLQTPNLASLTVDSLILEQKGTPPVVLSDSTLDQRHLESLEIKIGDEFSRSVVEWLLNRDCPVSVQHLRSLSLRTAGHVEFCDQVIELMRMASNVVNLELKINALCDHLPQIINIFTQLQSLTLIIPDSQVCVTTWLARTLENIDNTSIKLLNFVFWGEPTNRVELEAALTRPWFRDLETVRVSFANCQM